MNPSPDTIDDADALGEDLAMIAALAGVPSILQVVCQWTGMGYAVVARVTDSTWTACAVRDEIGFGLGPGGQLELRSTLCHEVRQTRKEIVIEHASRDPVYAGHHTPRIYGLESYISMPIVLADGSYFGNLCAIDRRPAAIDSPRIVEMFRLFSELIARQIDEARDHARISEALANERTIAELRERFIAALGHDLRGPLGAITAIAELLRRGAPSAKPAEMGERLLASSRRMAGLLDDLLDYARGRMGSGIELDLRPGCDVAALLRQVVAESQIADEHRDVRIEVDLDRHVHCDHKRLQQLMSNLVRNAIVHGDADQPIHISVRSEPGHYLIEVRNGGVPIPPEDLGSVFEPFWRGNPTRASHGGLGLGLFIAATIARAHGGSLTVTSGPEEGTTFTCRLPYETQSRQVSTGIESA